MSFALALLDKNPHRIQTTDIVWKLLLFSMLKANKQTHTLKKKNTQRGDHLQHCKGCSS